VKKYQIIYADPPWEYSFPGTRKEKKQDYSTMSYMKIGKLNISNIANENSVLFIWSIWTKIQECLNVIKMWGFEYKTVGFVWVKVRKQNNINQYSFLPQDSFEDFFGMGMWTRSNTEYCLIATKGNIKPISHSVKQLIYSPIGKHSEKPFEIKERIITLMGNLSCIELFARQKTEGWDVWGNEVESDIEL
jgi:site-specific DNA-methyltransferase (adenine-specific)